MGPLDSGVRLCVFQLTLTFISASFYCTSPLSWEFIWFKTASSDQTSPGCLLVLKASHWTGMPLRLQLGCPGHFAHLPQDEAQDCCKLVPLPLRPTPHAVSECPTIAGRPASSETFDLLSFLWECEKHVHQGFRTAFSSFQACLDRLCHTGLLWYLGRLAVFTPRVLENRQNILQFISLPFIILNLFRDTISSCSCFTCGFRAFLNALLRFCQVFSVLLEHLWSVFNLVFETVPFLSLSDFGHPSRGVLLSVL